MQREKGESMKLYYSKGACSLSVRIVLQEIGVPYEQESVNLKTKKTESGGDYLKINPKGAVPAIELANKEILTENVAIQQYLADEYKATPLLPPIGNFKRYRVLEWLSYVSSDLHKSFGPLFSPIVPQEIKDQIFIPALKKRFEAIEEHLRKNRFLIGDQFTLPDCYLFVVSRWLTALQIDVATTYPNLSRYMADIKKRKAVADALEEEGLS